MRMTVSLALVVGLLTGCGGGDESTVDPDRVVLGPAEPGSGHTHAAGTGATIGDGTAPTAGGWSLVDVRLPRRAGEPADLTFRIVDEAGEPLLDYTEEQTKLLHLYVVRNDLQDYRHLHPTLADDGTWTARVDLAGPGSYRVITEFSPASDPQGRHVVLGRSDIVPGTWSPEKVAATSTGEDGIVQVVAPETVRSGPDQRMVLTVTDTQGRSPHSAAISAPTRT